MQRFSVSVDDELAAWIEDKADERGVSKAKIIRDSVETARVTGLVRSDDVEPTEAKSLLDRIEMLETRVEAIESAGGQRDVDESASDTLVAAFKRQLAGQPPTTDHGEKAVSRVFELLLQEGTLSSKELRNQLAPEFEDHFADAESMWQSTQRYLSELDGIVKPGEGMWEADPTAIDTETGGLEDWEQS